MGEHAIEKAPAPAPARPVPASPEQAAQPAAQAGDARAAITAVMEAVDGLAPAPDGTFHTAYRGRVLTLTRDQGERFRAAARSALDDGLERSARRAEFAITRYQAHARLDAQMPISSGAIKAWASLTQSGYRDPGPDLPGLEAAVAQDVAAARQALAQGAFTEAARHLTGADAASGRLSALIGRYVEQTLEGGQSLLTSLEITKDVALVTLGVLATVASGGAALGLAPELLGTGIGGLTLGETLTAVSVGTPIVANVGKGAIAAAQGDTVDWTSIALDAAVQIVLVRLGGRLNSALLARLAGDPAGQAFARQAFSALAAGLATHELTQAFVVTVDQVLARWRGRFSWQGFADDLMVHLTDPVGLFMATLSSAIHLGVHRKVTAAAPAKAPPPPAASTTPPSVTPAPPPVTPTPAPAQVPASEPAAPATPAPVTAEATPSSVRPEPSTPTSGVHPIAAPAPKATTPVAEKPGTAPAPESGIRLTEPKKGGKPIKRPAPARRSSRFSQTEIDAELHTSLSQADRSRLAAASPTMRIDERAELTRSPGKPHPRVPGVKPFEERVTVGGLEGGRATYVTGELVPSDLRTGTRASVKPGGEHQKGDQNTHLLARLLGGSGVDRGNLAWAKAHFNLSTIKVIFEHPVIAALRAGKTVHVDVVPIYRGARLIALQVWARTPSGEIIVPLQSIPAI
ncbi:DNA/RNA non-specific endonuclease [Actinomadura fibrosa]|uniref:DNA/RNA non-specific endonuclease n=1 Tax=Actinomadura fibrosa TaxID=111802 RepID=A0ABW2XTL8_9ACTN|nr:DNA/RNA non-specific endonuclease [Actinomadura fibrosa]